MICGPISQAWTLAGAAPRYATPADPCRANSGARIAAIAQALGRPLMPWQRYVADVATERNPDGTYAYPVVVVSVPRQSGKTLLLSAMLTERCIMEDGHAAFYTAQTGKDARARWQDLVKLITASPLRRICRVKRSQGSERLEFSNGSVLQVFAPTEDSLHGYTPPTVALDEAFAHDERHGDELMGAIEPAQQTLPNRQLWIVSTRGDVDSVFLDGWIEKGLAGVPGVALFDWGASDHHDSRDPAHLLDFHPALGLPGGLGNGTTVETIIGSRLSAAKYERAYANRATAGGDVRRIDPTAWADLAESDVRPQPPPGEAKLTLTYDVAYDRTTSTISGTWTDDTGRIQHKVIRWAPGVSWVAAELAEFCRRWPNVHQVAADDTGPAREVTAEVRRITLPRGIEPRILATRELATAWGELLEQIRDGGFTHDGSARLADAARAVVCRPLLDSEAPSRRYSPGDIAPLMAAIVGLYAHRNKPPRDQRAVVRF